MPDVNEHPVSIALIAAVANNGIIGNNNALPWRIAADLQHFKRLTLGKKIVMGRKTFESIGSPLPGRTSIVITHNQNWRCGYAEVEVVHSVEEGLTRAVNLSLRDGNTEVMVIGGEQIYRATLSSAKRLYITRVLADVEGDASFPALEKSEWRETERIEHKAEVSAQYDFAFTILDRVTHDIAGNDK